MINCFYYIYILISLSFKGGDMMKSFTKQNSLLFIMFISVVGVLFSGFLSYREIFVGSCNLGFVSCGDSVGSIPACVYGLVMYAVVLIVSVLGYRNKK